MAKSDLRKFRSRIALLKRKGLISGVDARSVKPTTKIRGVKASTLITRNDDIVSGKVQPLKVASSKLRQYRKQGYETRGGRVLVPVLLPTALNKLLFIAHGDDRGRTVRVEYPLEPCPILRNGPLVAILDHQL